MLISLEYRSRNSKMYSKSKVVQMINEEVLHSIIKGCLKKKDSDMEKLYKYSYIRLLNVAVRYTQSITDAQWYFNLAMLRVFKALESYDRSKAYLPWARTIIIRSCIDQFRSKKALEVTQLESTHMDHYDDLKDFNAFLNTIEIEDIIDKLRVLPDNQRVVFSMFVIDDYTHKEIEELTGINKNTSKWLLSQAKKNLKSHLIPQFKSNEDAI